MERPLRLEYSGAVYHNYFQGKAREKIFPGDGDSQAFLEILETVVDKCNWLRHPIVLWIIILKQGNNMLHSPRTSLLLGLGAYGAICVAATVILTKWAVRKIFYDVWPLRIERFVIKSIVAIALTGVICLIYGRFIEPNWLKVEQVELWSSKLAGIKEPVVIAQISDLHIEGESKIIRKIPDIIAARHPDIIAFTGDAVNSFQGIPALVDLMNRLSRIAPTFVIYGTGDGRVKRLKILEKSGVKELDGRGQGFVVDINGTKVKVIGHSWEKIKIPKKNANDKPVFTLLLSHYPRVAVNLIKGTSVDLCLSGNTHGGQVKLPFLGAVSGSPEERKYLAGLYRIDNTWLYVNRGIGMSDSAPKLRFNSRPEITFFYISGQDG